MSNTQNPERIFDSSNLVVYIYQWRKPILIVTLVAGILAAIFSSPFFIDPKYKSTVTVFPTTTNSLSKALLPQDFASRGQDIMEFGDEEQAEQLLQILNSDGIRNRIISEFDLLEHYDINPDGKYVQTELYETYGDNISYRRTEFMSVEINVLDTDPDTAALIANRITELLDEAKTRIQRERALKGLAIIKGQFEDLKFEINKMEDSINILRGKGILNYEEQSAVLTEQLATARIEGKPKAVKQIQQQMDTLGKYGGTFIALRDELRQQREEMGEVKNRLQQAKVDVEQSLPASFKVNEAYPAEKKSYPTRWLIVALSMIGAFIITLVAILLRDTILGYQTSKSA